MTKIFISYSRADYDKCSELVRRLRKLYGYDNVWFDADVHGGADWWRVILEHVAWCNIFIYLVSRESLESPYCQKELRVAIRRGKQIFPILIRSRATIPPTVAHYQWVNAKDGFTADVMTDVAASINELERESQRNVPVLDEPDADENVPPNITQELQHAKRLAPRRNIGVAVALIAVLVTMIVALWPLAMTSPINAPNLTSTTDQVARLATEQPSLTPIIIPTTAASFTFAPTLPIPMIVASLDAQATLDQATVNANASLASRATAYQLSTMSAANQTATATFWTNTTTPNITMTIEAYRTQAAATTTQAWIDSWTDTPTLTPSSTMTLTPTATTAAIGYPSNPVMDNAQWTAITRVFDDGVTMVLVPTGCFEMGSTTGSNDEQPAHQQCFDSPFWIDQTEVTQSDFARLGGVKAVVNAFHGDHPVVDITWLEARDFCVLRSARLPTEAEWEYAARGPDNLLYPWGNRWNPNNAVWNGSGSQGAVAVGSIPSGRSWVGALDMSGNVWEWVNTIYGIDVNGDYNFSDDGESFFSYPYNTTDGREESVNDSSFVRGIRGGSWYNANISQLRAAYRYGNYADNWYSTYGFRCARSF